jgi:hypothetical protein
MNAPRKRKNKGSDFRVYVGTSFPNAVFCEIEALALKYGITNAQVVRDLSRRGLAAYHRDGQLAEFAEASESCMTARASDFAEKRASGVVTAMARPSPALT